MNTVQLMPVRPLLLRAGYYLSFLTEDEDQLGLRSAVVFPNTSSGPVKIAADFYFPVFWGKPPSSSVHNIPSRFF